VRQERGFTLVEVLVALMIVAIALAALMVAVSGTARTSGYLRDKTLAQWIALNRITEVRLNTTQFGQNTDTGEIDFGNRKWHYDTRYFDTTIATMKRVVVRVYLGDAKTKGNPIVESVGFTGTATSVKGTSNNTDWTSGATLLPTGPAGPVAPGTTPPGTAPGATPGITPTLPTSPPVTPPSQTLPPSN
jgi:general secretion pathway protein I